MAASATFALKVAVWFRRGRLFMVSPDSLGKACPLSGRNSTYRSVQISETSSLRRRKPESLVGPSWRLRRLQFPTTPATAPYFLYLPTLLSVCLTYQWPHCESNPSIRTCVRRYTIRERQFRLSKHNTNHSVGVDQIYGQRTRIRL